MKITFKKILAAAAIGVGVYAAVKAFKKFNAPIEQTMTVTDKRWSKVETVAEWGTENGEGWEVPDNAYDVESTLKYRDTSDVLTSALNVGVSAGKVFMNGEANDIVMTNVGTLAPKKELARYYTWKIDKWFHVEDVKTSGNGKASEAYGDSTGVKYDPSKQVEEGDRKVSGREVHFTVSGINDETGQSVVVEVAPTVYDLAKKGGKLRYTITKLSKKPKNAGVINPFGGKEAGDDNGEVDREA